MKRNRWQKGLKRHPMKANVERNKQVNGAHWKPMHLSMLSPYWMNGYSGKPGALRLPIKRY